MNEKNIEDELDDDCFSGKDLGDKLARKRPIQQKKNICFEINVAKVFEDTDMNCATTVVF